MFYLKDPKTNKYSVTLTAFVFGFFIATIKLLFSGMEVVNKVKMSEFSGTDYAAVIGALGIIYTMRKNKTIKPETVMEDKDNAE